MATAAVAAVTILAEIQQSSTGVSVLPDPIELSKGNGDQVEWISRSASGFQVVFAESPFQASTFIVPSNSSVHSGAAIQGTVGTTYKYSIRDAAGKLLLDPRIVIKY